MHQTLTIPQHRDPVARAALIACAMALCWLAITSALPPVQAQEQLQPTVVILVATPTPPALPTEVPAVAAPALAAATAIPPTFAPGPFPTEAPAVVVAPVQEAPAVGERVSDKAGPGEHKAPPVVRH